jgi:hypothetical protein
MVAQDIPQGGEVVINGKRYVCEKAVSVFEDGDVYSCNGCGLFYTYGCSGSVLCRAEARADRTEVIYKEVE